MCRLRNIAMRDYQKSVTTGQTVGRQTDGRTDRRTDRQTPDKVIPLCRYASQATQKTPLSRTLPWLSPNSSSWHLMLCKALIMVLELENCHLTSDLVLAWTAASWLQPQTRRSRQQTWEPHPPTVPPCLYIGPTHPGNIGEIKHGSHTRQRCCHAFI